MDNHIHKVRKNLVQPVKVKLVKNLSPSQTAQMPVVLDPKNSFQLAEFRPKTRQQATPPPRTDNLE